MRYITGRSVKLTHVFYDDDGETQITPTGVACTVDGVARTVAGDGSVTLPAQTLGVHTVVWSSTTPVIVESETFEVVGGFLFTVPEARASDPDLSSAVDVPPGLIVSTREIVEREFQTITGRSFTPRVKTLSVPTDADVFWTRLFDVTNIALTGPSGAVDGSLFTQDADGILTGVSGLPSGSYTASVQYGFSHVPADIKRAALIRLRFLIAAQSSGVPDRATSFIAETGGTFTLATPGRNGYRTGIPEVDAILDRYSFNVLYDVLSAV